MNNERLMAIFITYRKYDISFPWKSITLPQGKELTVREHSLLAQCRTSSICLAMNGTDPGCPRELHFSLWAKAKTTTMALWSNILILVTLWLPLIFIPLQPYQSHFWALALVYSWAWNALPCVVTWRTSYLLQVPPSLWVLHWKLH